MANLTKEEYEEVEANFLGISVECLRSIRREGQPRQPAKRLKGNKYVKFYDQDHRTLK